MGRLGNGSPFSYPTLETPCPEKHEHDGRSGVVHHVTGRLFPQGHDAKHCSASKSEKCRQSP